MSYKERIDKAIQATSIESQELIDCPTPLYDWAHEHATGHEDVIKPFRARENVKGATSGDLERAYSSFEDCGGLGDDMSNLYDRTATPLSYWLEFHRFIGLVKPELEELKETLEEIIDEISSDIDDLDENDEDLVLWHDQVEEIINDIETILG